MIGNVKMDEPSFT